MRVFWAIVFMMVVTLPTGCVGLSYGTSAPLDEPVSITVTSPGDGAEVWVDVVPPHVAVSGETNAPSGLRSILVRSNAGEISCVNETRFACSVPVSEGENRITIIAIDALGNRAEKNLNVTVRIGMPPPRQIFIAGRVTDTKDNPVPGAFVRFESTITVDNKPIVAANMTGEDGRYLVEDAIGYRQTVRVQKEGYYPLQRDIRFDNLTNNLDLTLEPSGQAAPGFGLYVVVLAYTGGFLLLRCKKK